MFFTLNQKLSASWAKNDCADPESKANKGQGASLSETLDHWAQAVGRNAESGISTAFVLADNRLAFLCVCTAERRVC